MSKSFDLIHSRRILDSTYNWNQSIVKVDLLDWFHVQNDFLNAILEKVKENPNRKIHLYATGPFRFHIFKNHKNVTWEYDWQGQSIGEFYKLCNQNKFKQNINFLKNIEHTVCSFNGSFHWSRMFFILALYQSGLWNDKFCSKSKKLIVRGRDMLSVLQSHGLEKIMVDTKQKDFRKFLLHVNEFEYDRYNHFNNVKVLNNIMNKTFVNAISETYAEGLQPWITEKTFYGVVTKSLTLTLGQYKWYKVFNECYGFKNFNCFDYNFDSNPDLFTRILSITDQLVKMSHLTKEEKQFVYENNKEVLEYNYHHFMSGEWIKFCESATKNLDKILQ